jgi:hypothetical protein
MIIIPFEKNVRIFWMANKQSFPHDIIENGEHIQMWKTDEGVCHREDGPALICRNGKNITYAWMWEGALHRDYGMYTAIICDATTNAIVEKGWIYDGGYHRLDGPASIVLTPNKHIFGWYVDGVHHRGDGPAIITRIISSTQPGRIMHKTMQYGFKGVLFNSLDERVKLKEFYNSIITRDDAIVNIRHDNHIIRKKCKDILDERS